MSKTLSDYLTQVRRLLKDPNGATYQTPDLTAYINEARNQVALETECVRYLWAYDNSGTYTLTATAAVGNSVLSGIVSTAAVNFGDRVVGAGAPAGAFVINKTSTTITMNAPANANASGSTFTLTPQFTTQVGQEVYPYGANVDPVAGILNVIQCKGIAVNWGGALGTINLTLEQWSFTKFQAMLGYYGNNLTSQPCVWVRYGVYARLRPIPSASYPMQWDTACTPIPLVTDATVDAIPSPHDETIKYYGAWLALLGAQRQESADAMLKSYETFAKRANTFVQRTMVPYVYR